MKLHMMTWNCNLYVEPPSSLNWERYDAIVNIVKERLELENSVVALQEIPYKSNETWLEHPFYQSLLNDFPKDKYNIVYSVSDHNQIMMSMMIYKKNVFEDDIEVKKNNRIVGCRKDDIVIAAVHMPTDFQVKRGDKHKYTALKKWKEGLWDQLIAFAKERKAKAAQTVILGDFNAFIGCKDTYTESKFIELLRYVDDIIADDVATFEGGTTIDHILTHFHAGPKYKYCMEDDFEWSDHKYITAEFEL